MYFLSNTNTMKKIKLLLTLAFLSVFLVQAQESIIATLDSHKLDAFIQLAYENYPRKKIFEANEEAAKSSVAAAKLSYLESFQAAYYYRPNNRVAVDVINPYLVNGFQLGINVNVGTILQKPALVKQAKKQYEVAQLENQEYRGQLETEVKSRFYNYLQLASELKLRTQAAQDNSALFDKVRVQFEQGEVGLETYSAARSAVTDANSTLTITETNFLRAKDMLEEIIGKKLEEVN